jgi:hypothetical protein
MMVAVIRKVMSFPCGSFRSSSLHTGQYPLRNAIEENNIQAFGFRCLKGSFHHAKDRIFYLNKWIS